MKHGRQRIIAEEKERRVRERKGEKKRWRWLRSREHRVISPLRRHGGEMRVRKMCGDPEGR